MSPRIRAILLSAIVVAAGLTPAMADERAVIHGRQEAALEVCPRVVITDPKLRAQRNKKYRGSRDFRSGYQYVVTQYNGIQGQDALGITAICGIAIGLTAVGDEKTWLKIEWTDADREPLVSKEALAGKSGGVPERLSQFAMPTPVRQPPSGTLH